jgi:plastocyanin
MAEEWGDLTATFVYDGEIPSESPLKVTTDVEFCGKFKLVDESLVVNPESKGIANVFAYLYIGRTDTPPKVHPSYDKSAKDEVTVDNNKCRFEPHAAVLRSSQTLLMTNSDEVGHNCKVDTIINSPINYTIPAGGKLKHQFTVAERLPSRVSCSIHPWMSGWLLVKDNPYMAVSDENGKLVIKNLPVGQWTIQFWQEKAGYISDVIQDGKPAKWSRGRLEVKIAPGENHLGTIKLGEAAFAE